MGACESIVDVITQFNFNTLTSHAIPDNVRVPNENAHTHFIAFDFGICENEKGEYEPMFETKLYTIHGGEYCEYLQLLS